MREITYCQAINEALMQVMARYKNTFIMGLGVDDVKRVFGSTIGLSEKFGKGRAYRRIGRVIDRLLYSALQPLSARQGQDK